MNFKKFINSDYLKNNPLCGINTYKDELNLATGACTRPIKKLVLTGEESWGGTSRFRINLSGQISTIAPICTHYRGAITAAYAELADGTVTVNGGTGLTLAIYDSVNQTSLTAWKSYLAQQYANGTPVTVWYILATPTTETITVPSGLSGTEEGYLNQSGTPTPDNPIYPTANTVEKWFDTPHYIHNTSTDTLTTLPAVLYPNAVTATVGLKGDMVQSSQPSPLHPIQPSECGERTGNLFDKDNTTGIIANTFINQSGAQISNSDYYISAPINIEAEETYTWSFSSTSTSRHTSPTVGFYDENNSLIGAASHNNTVYNFAFTTPSGCKYIRASVYTANSNYTSMLVKGDVSQEQINLPFIPYGYKIPISSANTTTPVYLGEVETTRKIKKYVFTGEESGTIYSTATSRKGIEITGITGIIGGNADITILAICTHYQPNTRTALYRNTDNGISNAYQNDSIIFYDTNCQTVEAFQQFCTQQYTAGTPVTVWYVLAEPTTGIVNEPLMKIGDYADEVSDISIPTIAGANTLSIGTALQPSEVTVNYKGWHPVSAVHERINGAWD